MWIKRKRGNTQMNNVNITTELLEQLRDVDRQIRNLEDVREEILKRIDSEEESNKVMKGVYQNV
jgi:flagellar motility protein MotE (MotC chaperone)